MIEEIKISIEGLEINRLLVKFSDEGIELRKLTYISQNKITFVCKREVLPEIEKYAKNRFRIEILDERGLRTSLKKLAVRKTAVFGIILFTAVIIYQSLFITKIEINGVQSIEKDSVLKVLSDNGIYAGCRRGNYDLEAAEFDIFEKVKGIAWMELHEDGGIITAEIVESVKAEISKEEKPQNIVALKEGFIEEVIALNGKNMVSSGQHVNPGDILISGEIVSKIDETSVRYVHAEGKVFARCIYVLSRKEPKTAEEESLTGRFLPGVCIRFGDFTFDSSELTDVFKSKYVKEQPVIDINIPLPVKLTFKGENETCIMTRERSMPEIMRNAEIELIKELKKNITEGGRIANKDLQFKEEENIIEVKGIFEVIEEIGGEEPIIYERTENQHR
ncbi:MAG: sporulation protein YqfD [Bacillota bacterium]|nr:sporulation protein YqfD [Bacillota bacterium]